MERKVYLQTLLNESGLTVRKFSKNLGIRETNIYNYKSGRMRITEEVLSKLISLDSNNERKKEMILELEKGNDGSFKRKKKVKAKLVERDKVEYTLRTLFFKDCLKNCDLGEETIIAYLEVSQERFRRFVKGSENISDKFLYRIQRVFNAKYDAFKIQLMSKEGHGYWLNRIALYPGLGEFLKQYYSILNMKD